MTKKCTDQQIVDAYNNKLGIVKIQQRLHVSVRRIVKVLKDARIETNGGRTLNKFQEKNVVERYLRGESSRTIAKIYNMSPSGINNILKREKTVMRGWKGIYTFDKNFFDIIDTETKAYWLGFLWADGYNSGHSIVLPLAKKDMDTIENFKNDIGYTGPIGEYSSRARDGGKICHKAVLSLHGVDFSRKMKDIGMNNKKTIMCHYPKVPSNLDSHFIRGYFDGDGCLYFRERKTGSGGIKNCAFSIVSNEKILREIGDKVRSHTGVCYKIYDKTNSDIAKTFFLARREDIRIVMKWLYKDCTRRMDRKFNKFMEFERLLSK